MRDANRGRPDFLLLLLTCMLVGFGLTMIFSASTPIAMQKYGSFWFFVHRQALFAVAGLALMFSFMRIPVSFWKKAAPFLILVSLLLLGLVLVFGTKINGARRWFIVAGFNFQPSEFAKFAIIVYLSAMIGKKGERIRSFLRGLLPMLIMVGANLAMIMLQPDFGTVLILFLISGAIVLISGARLGHLIALGLGFIPLLVYLSVSKSYRLKRMNAFVDPFHDASDSGYQLVQSLTALGHGGFTGAGLGRSIQKYFYLPEAHTDFIFAVVGEELGFIGVSGFFLVYFLFLWRAFLAAYRSSEPFAAMLGMGIATMIAIQFLMNVGAVTGSLPVTGVPLPFISYGGTSLLLCMACTGILLGIARDNNRRLQGRHPES
ncbi:putative lipid II flippase FtsW [Cohnella nanjingensis]|uniref:Probable peptidoglycan glycosyltransferase FtsW n=1 Tax=Cohnella nanjingensis TaxID=1387779 RepID=A0A7X0RNV6_9BACL|nr:putative lipid II flippase FtsW [Cohnella nanjingensis]MBB6670723.1 putative lipid II flippase FtsW [Cohnella nanjingensis]